MKKFLLAFVFVVVPWIASAADLPMKAVRAATVAPACTWCGLYIGGSLGWGGADFKSDFSGQDFNSFSLHREANSVVGGINVGYDYQFGSFVVGAVTDVSLSGIKKTENNFLTELPWFGTTRLRGGYLIAPDLLVYASGGVAYGHVKAGTVPDGAVLTTPTVGWTLGGGAEYAFTRNLSVSAEYLHVDLDGPTVTSGLLTVGTRVPANIVRGVVNYRF